jgi:hypothetical protein
VRCAMTGQPLRDYSDAIDDDGEWISWDWINGQLADQELRQEYPNLSRRMTEPAESSGRVFPASCRRSLGGRACSHR